MRKSRFTEKQIMGFIKCRGRTADQGAVSQGRTSHDSTQGRTIWSYSDQRVIVSKSNSVSEQRSSGSKPSEASVKKPTDKQSGKPRFVSEEAWLQAISDGTKRMSQDDAFRLEIARRLS